MNKKELLDIKLVALKELFSNEDNDNSIEKVKKIQQDYPEIINVNFSDREKKDIQKQQKK